MQISRYEKGITSITPALIDRICTTFNVDPRYFNNPDAEDAEDAEEMDVSEAVKVLSDEEKNKAVAARLRDARESCGWSQNELSRRSGVNAPLINRVEAGSFLTEKQGKKLAEALEVGVDWLMNGDESKKLYPLDERLMNWLWENEEIREELWKRMEAEEDEE